jgi:hypothetical protein
VSKEIIRLAHKSGSMVYWFCLLLASLLFLTFTGFGIIALWSVFFVLTLIPSFLFRTRDFAKLAKRLLGEGEVLKPYDYAKQTKTLLTLLFLGVLALIAPLFLTQVLSVKLWFGTLLGVINGWLAQQLLFNLYLMVWERKHKGFVYKVNIWKGSKVVQTGFTFTRVLRDAKND